MIAKDQDEDVVAEVTHRLIGDNGVLYLRRTYHPDKLRILDFVKDPHRDTFTAVIQYWPVEGSNECREYWLTVNTQDVVIASNGPFWLYNQLQTKLSSALSALGVITGQGTLLDRMVDSFSRLLEERG